MTPNLFAGPPLLVALLCLASVVIQGQGRHSESTPSVESQDFTWTARGQFVGLLFGRDQWKLGQYCADQRSSSQISASDARIESLHNGSYLEPIDGTSDWPRVLERLDGSNQISLEARQKLGLICSASTWGYADAQEESQSNAPHENELECRAQLRELAGFVETLANKTAAMHKCQLEQTGDDQSQSEKAFNLHLWTQFHSFGRSPSGPPHKQHLWLGDFDACARLESTRYCLGSYGLDGAASGPGTALKQVGLCLPRACSSATLQRSELSMSILDALVRRTVPEVALGDRRRLRLTGVFCPPASNSNYKRIWAKDGAAGALLYVAPAVWAVLLVWATFVLGERSGAGERHKRSEPKSDKMLGSFKLTSNWTKFTDARDLDPRLAGLNCIKTLAMNWLMVTHISMTVFPYVSNLNELSSYYGRSLLGPLILQGQHGVPLFFIVSGVLFGAKQLGPREKQHGVGLARMIIGRYFRLAPMYLLAYAYIKKFAHLLGDGPLWDSGVSSQSEWRQCRVESWWVPLLMLANFTPPFAHCLITGWHIANDFQIYLLLPLLLIAYGRSRATGCLAASAAFLATHLSHVWLWAASQDYDFLTLLRDPFRFGPRLVLDRLALDYVNPLGRLGTYFLGVVVADLALSGGGGGGGGKQGHAGANLATSRRFQQATVMDGRQRELSDEGEDQRPLQRPPTRKSSESVTAPPAAASVGFPDDQDQAARAPPATFKDICLLALAILLAGAVLFSVLIPADQATLFGSYTKALAYPACRIAIELSWSVLLFVLLKTNRRARARARPPEETVDSKATGTAAKTGGKLLQTPSGEKNSDEHGQRQSLLTRLLKLPGWNVAVKLNYSLMLTHHAIIRMIVQTQRELFLFTWVNFFQFVTFALAASYLFALLVHLAVEMPLSALARSCLDRALPPARPKVETRE